ncbi:hypothetical protein ACPV4H_06190 [Vibrio rotiferianus]|uniref:hypothetical protein n=1 Tax=Vibrio rotiferianus TaxID=190895 RepID=UPI00406A9FB0
MLRTLIISFSLLLTTYAFAGNLSISTGALISDTNTSVSIEVPTFGAKLNLDGEDHLALGNKITSPYVNISYEIDDTHTIYFDWLSIHRRSSLYSVSPSLNLLGSEYQADGSIRLNLEIDIARIGYAYSVYNKNKWKLDLLAGLHLLRLKAKGDFNVNLNIDSNNHTFTEKSLNSSSVLPLPNFGFRIQYQLLQDLTLNAHSQAFMLATQQLNGLVTDFSLGANYQISENWSAEVHYTEYDILVSYSNSLLNTRASINVNGPILTLQYKF